MGENVKVADHSSSPPRPHIRMKGRAAILAHGTTKMTY